MCKRTFGLILVLAVLLSMLPAGAVYAAEEAAPEQLIECTGVYGLDKVRPTRSSADDYVIFEEGIEEITQHLINRKSSFTVYCYDNYDPSLTEDGIAALGSVLIYAAMGHTGNPVGGDYLMWHVGTGNCEVAYGVDDSESWAYYQFKYTNMSYYTTSSQEKTLTTKVNSLVSSLEGKTEYQKVKSIYEYICENVEFDEAGLNNDSDVKKYTAYGAMIQESAISMGYNSLFYRLMLELGMDCRIIIGELDGSLHTWNIVKIGSQYYNVDPTLDAVLTQNGQEWAYFLKCDASFPEHIRLEDYDTSSFHKEYPMDTVDYDPDWDLLTIPIDAEHFPDQAFRQKVANDFDSNNDGYLDHNERNAGSIYLSSSQWTFYSFEGIEYFPNLTTLCISQSSVTALDLSKNPKLTSLEVDECPLTELDLSHTPNLTTLDCTNVQLKELDVSNLTELSVLKCSENQLQSLDLSNNTKLTQLYCNGNQLTSLELANSVTRFQCAENTYTIRMDENWSFDLTTLPGKFDITKASQWEGGTVNGNILTVPEGGGTVSYTYDCGYDRTAVFTLICLEHIHIYENGACTICSEPVPPYTLGDVDENDLVNILDVMAIINIITGSFTPSQMQTFAADVNGDGTVNILDAMALINTITGA